MSLNKENKNIIPVKLIVMLVVAGIIGLIGGFYIIDRVYLGEASTNKTAKAINSSETVSFSTGNYQTKSDSQASVTVDVTPKVLGIDNEKNIFSVTLNTHSVELDFDFAQVITMEDDQGNVYQAFEWTGNRGWHHVSGDIIFPRLKKGVSSIELKIAGVGEVDRIFKWDLI